MLDHWHTHNSQSISDALTRVDTLSEAVLEFFSLWLDTNRFSATLEQAIRDWARLDNKVLAKVREEDQLRIAQIQQCYVRFNYTRDEALVRARILYFAQIGYYAMHMEESMHDRLAMTSLYYQSFTGRKLNARVAKTLSSRFKHST